MSTALAAMAGLLACLAALDLIVPAVGVARRRAAVAAERAIGVIEQVAAPLRRLDRSGGLATSTERTKLTVAGGGAGLAVGLLIGGLLLAVGLAVAAAVVAPRALAWRAERYRRAVEAGAATAALALASALAAGHSVRASFGVAGRELDGPVATELARVASELELGERTEQALAGLQARVRSHRIDLIVAAVVMQRRSGGNLAWLLRRIAATVTDHDRLLDEARAASAQARFTSTLVLAMPVGGLVLGELASPGLAGRVASSPIGISMVVTAVVLQVVGAVMVRRFSRLPA